MLKANALMRLAERITADATGDYILLDTFDWERSELAKLINTFIRKEDKQSSMKKPKGDKIYLL
jgi:hypothetical protein